LKKNFHYYIALESYIYKLTDTLIFQDRSDKLIETEKKTVFYKYLELQPSFINSLSPDDIKKNFKNIKVGDKI